MNLKEIREMIQLMDDNQLVELELERDGLKVKLKKAGGEAPIGYAPMTMPVPQAGAPAAATQEPARPAANTVEIVAPMVGTFYRAPAPDAAPFTDTGQKVEIGQVVCILEAMKLMNEIKAEVTGTIVDVLVENGEPVEFGQPLFRVQV
ncbi:MAG: acetyl-CoA carboxylase biotin carboxyl carrier protein [Candidatus Omnitrophica bacterium]|nr:acetyl-CoA carboxylase biotin carboxyl carrier protein [Candidatus Omnitrophota bacterium]